MNKIRRASIRVSIFWTALTFSVFAFASVLSITGIAPNSAEAAISNWQKGASIYPLSTTDFASDSFKQSLRDLKATGADTAVLIIPIYQANDQASEIQAGGDTPTDESLVSAIQYAHSIGLKVNLKPHLGSWSGSWRAYINASDRDAWFRNYGAYLNHLGDISRENGVEGMTIGTELISMASGRVNPDNTRRWNALIADLRSHFSGYLTYSANWSWNSDHFEGEVKHIEFWPSLDYIGISAYYPLAGEQNNPSVEALTGAWDYWNNSQIRALHEKWNKPIVFTEIGYTSIDGAHKAPCCTWGGSYDEQEQVNDYEALFSYWNGQSFMAGVYLWNWSANPNYGGQGNLDYVPQNKAAEQVMTKWFGGNGTPPPPPPPPDPGTGGDTGGGTGGDTGGDTGGGTGGDTGGGTGGDTGGNTGGDTGTPSDVTGNFEVSATGPSSIVAGQPAALKVNVSNTGQATNVIVDVEIYDSATMQVLQSFYEGQSMGSGAPKSYDISWTPPSNGNYVLKVGLFNRDWTNLYQWNDQVLTLNVGSTGGTGGDTGGGTGGDTGGDTGGGDTGGTGEPTGPTGTDLWWPGSGARIAYDQPFKAMLIDDRPLSSYEMYWQVDGGELHRMYDSNQDYPHKEDWVNVSNWPRKDANSSEDKYNVTFISKNREGQVVSEKTVEVIVGR